MMAEDFPESIDTSVPIEETSHLISSDKVEGTAVYDKEGARIGHILNVMLNKRSGAAEYAVMAFGGFLGLGERHHPVPWKALRYDTDLGGYTVGLDKEKLKEAPSHSPGEEVRYDQAYEQGLYTYYGLPWAPLATPGVIYPPPAEAEPGPRSRDAE